MALVEKLCRFCQTYFYYEDGLDLGGLGARNEHDRGLQGRKEKNHGYCPNCIDPHFIPGETYQKEVILHLFKRHLTSHSISIPDNDTLIEMMKNFPRSYACYTSNGTYRTFNLSTGLIFNGEFGQFQLLEVKVQQTHHELLAYMRNIKCTRCGRVVCVDRKKALEFFVGLKEKCCANCDNKRGHGGMSDHERDTTGLNRNGASKSEFSDRAMAKALNVSRNDYRRHIITQRVEPLPLGTVISKSLLITQAWWDENPDSYSPKYTLECQKCKQIFYCVQKKVQLLQHFC